MERNKDFEPWLAPLFGRACCAKRYPKLFEDPLARRVVEQCGYPFEYLKIRESQAVGWSINQWFFCERIRHFLETHPDGVIVDAGCGLDTMFPLVDNGRCTWINLDFEDVLELRGRLMPCGEREQNLAANLLQEGWLDQVKEKASGGFYFVASDVIGLITEEHVKELMGNLAAAFPGGGVCFDIKTSRGARRGSKRSTGLFKGGTRHVFHIDDGKKLLNSWGLAVQEIKETTVLPSRFASDTGLPPLVQGRIQMNWRNGAYKFVELSL